MAKVIAEGSKFESKKGARFWLGISWLVLCLILTIASGGAWAFTMFGLVIATIFFLGCEKLFRGIVGKDK